MLRHYLAILATIVLFSTVEVISKRVGGIDPNLLAFLRFFPSGVLLLLIGWDNIRSLTRGDAFFFVVLGTLGIGATFIAYHGGLALEHLPASTGAVIFSVNPVFTALAAAVILRERLSGARVLGVLLGIAGVYVVGFGWSVPAFETARGPLMMFGAQISFGIYIAAGKKYVRRYGPFFVTGTTFVVGSFCFLPLVAEWPSGVCLAARSGDPSVIDGPMLGWLLYLALGTTGLGYLLYFYGLNHVPTAAGTSIFYLKPVLASILAVAVLNETLPLHFYVGLGIILGSLTLTLFTRRERA
jgi:drug/metabolite transporter (DMT)-like permease